MIHIGDYQTLTIKREMPQGFYLEDEEGNEVLMPRPFLTDAMRLDDKINVFVYTDSNDIAVATTETPQFTVGQFAYLYVMDVNEVGAFCEWGVSKELFIPFRNQAVKLRPDHRYVVYMYLDERSNRLVGSTKLNHYLKLEADEFLEMGQEVDMLIFNRTEMGYKVVIDQTYSGLVYENETHQTLRIGDELKGYIKPLREDGKIDVSLTPIGHQSIEPNAQKILDKLKGNQGFLPFTDKSDPNQIRAEFGISKKLFKKSLGALYRQKLVLLKEDGVYLN